MSIFDYIHRNTPLGFVKKDDVDDVKGAEIPYNDLDRYIGKKILYSMPRQGAIDYKVVLMTSFSRDCENIYDEDGKPVGKVSRAGFSDNTRNHKENSWTNELYCSNGRYKGEAPYQSCMYELV